MPRVVRVQAASRLHFGMLSFGNPACRQFGGVGAMVDAPGLELEITLGDQLTATGPLASRALTFAERVACGLAVEQKQDETAALVSRCRIEILQAPDEHVGLGVGTQLGLSVAAGLLRMVGRALPPPAELAALAGRGLRSAVGLYGFAQGGLLFEAGKFVSDANGSIRTDSSGHASGDPAAPTPPPDKLSTAASPLVGRVPLPADWRFVLMRPKAADGLSGAAEQRAFDRLTPVLRQTTNELCAEAALGLLPAAAEGAFDAFSESLYRFGKRAGECFAAAQGGAFASHDLADWVRWIRSQGVEGVGQSSWGPTLFAVLPDAAAADDLSQRARDRGLPCDQITVASPVNAAAQIETLDR